jgi:hypothetical protein
MRLLAIRIWLAAGAALAGLFGFSHQAHAAVVHHAALVIQHGGGGLITRCVAFVEAQISGVELIQRSKIEYQAQQFGALGGAFCQIDGEPAQVPPGCFGTGPYWQYFHRTAAGWTAAGAGASNWSLHDGDMDGWHFASGLANHPPALSFNSVCLPAVPAAARPAPSHSGLSSAQPTIATTRAGAPAATIPQPPSNATAPSPGIQALLQPSASPRPKSALAAIGPKARPASQPLNTWLLLGGTTALLIGLAALNLRRRAG